MPRRLRHRHFGVVYVLAIVGLVVAPPATIQGGSIQTEVRTAVTAERLELAVHAQRNQPASHAIPLRTSARARVERPASSTPVSITVPRIDIEGPIVPVGIAADRQLDVPLALTAGWYRHSSTPETPGATVIAAHVDFEGQPGLFFDLRLAATGDIVRLELADGSHIDYVVSDVVLYDKSELPSEQLFRSAGDHALHLVTCGGSFDRFARSYRGNQVITALPITS
ncbi:MAG: class F sortase [Acidimicrobiales bacterium]